MISLWIPHHVLPICNFRNYLPLLSLAMLLSFDCLLVILGLSFLFCFYIKYMLLMLMFFCIFILNFIFRFVIAFFKIPHMRFTRSINTNRSFLKGRFLHTALCHDCLLFLYCDRFLWNNAWNKVVQS